MLAARWVWDGPAQAPRRDGDEWEVDVSRLDGGYQLLGLDKERGADGGVAPDELRGAAQVGRVLRQCAQVIRGSRNTSSALRITPPWLPI